MVAELEAILSTRDAAEWEHLLSNAGIPCGMVRRVDEAASLCDPAALLDVHLPNVPGNGHVAVPNAGFRMTPGNPGTNQPPPPINGNRDEILAWLDADD
jgi:CoA:oxalate CoA-transferase